jgi:hypothetical protein
MASAAKAATLPAMSLGGASTWFGMTAPDQVKQLTDRQLNAILREKAAETDALTQAVREEISAREKGTSTLDEGPSIFAKNAVTYNPQGYMTVAPFSVSPENSALGNIAASLGNGLVGGIPTAFARAGQDIWAGVNAVKDFAITPEAEMAKRAVASQQPGPASLPSEGYFGAAGAGGAPVAPAKPQNPSFDLPGSPFPLPPQLVAPQLQPPPELGAPPQLAPMAAPDFSSYDAAMAQAAPTPISADELEKQKSSLMMAGLAKGLAGFDGAQPGSWGQGWGSIAAGLTGGEAQAEQQRLSLQREDMRAAQQYALSRASGEWNKGAATREVDAQNQKIDYSNRAAVYETDNANKKSKVDYNNAVATNAAEVQNKNSANVYSANLKQYELMQPDIKAVPGGMSVSTRKPDGTTHVEIVPQETIAQRIEQFKMIGAMEEALGENAVPVLKARYASMTPLDRSLDIMTRIFKAGQAEKVFGPTFAQNMQRVKQQLMTTLKPDPVLLTDPKYVEKFNNQVWAAVAQDLLSSPEISKNSAWIAAAAAAGDPGALLIIQGQ